jgi:hypothetical protein
MDKAAAASWRPISSFSSTLSPALAGPFLAGSDPSLIIHLQIERDFKDLRDYAPTELNGMAREPFSPMSETSMSARILHPASDGAAISYSL